jgi:hypothetical protein
MANATALQVPESQARKLFKDLNDSAGAKASPKKLAKKLVDFATELNGESIEDLDLTGTSKSLIEEVLEAIDDDRDVEVVQAEEENGEEEEVPVRGKRKKTKTRRTKTVAKKGTKKAKRKASGESTYKPNPEYAERRTKEGIKIDKEIDKGPKSYEALAQKTGLPESRIRGHVKFKKYTVKGGKVYGRK